MDLKEKKKKKFKMPTAFTILFFIIAFLVIMSWILHWSGVTFDVEETSQTVNAMGILDIFWSICQGFVDKAEIIIFILVLGGFIFIILETKALEAFTQAVAKKLGNKSIYLIPIMMFFFSFCGSTYGMAEETLGFYMILIPLVLSMGYDKLTGLMIVLFGAGSGVLASTVNPFVIAVAVQAANDGGATVASSDGMAWRWISWVVITIVAIVMVTMYAIKVRKNPEKSYTFSTLEGDKKFFLGEEQEEIKFTKKRIATLIIFLMTFVIMVIYLVAWDEIIGGTKMEFAGEWINEKIPYLTALIPGFGMGYLVEVSVFFFVSALIIAIIGWTGEENYANAMVNGARDLLGVCLVIATAGGVGIIMEKSGIQGLVVNGLSKGLNGLHSTLFLFISFIIFLPLSFLIPSTSGFAAAIFPVWGPLAAGGSSVSGSILAFSFANGILNLFTPTSGVVMGALGIAKMDYGTFMKGAWKFILVISGTALALLLVGSALPTSIF